MGKLDKLKFNSEKLIKTEELLTLKGGYKSCCVCLNSSGMVMGYMAGNSSSQCTTNCGSAGWIGSYGNFSYCGS
jgi:hypothetical protein